MTVSRRNSNSSCTLKKTGSSVDDGRAREQYLMSKSKEFLKPGPLFRTVTQLYAERKLVLFLTIHYIVTLIVWAHYALMKWDLQQELVPDDAPFYWFQCVGPPIIFGCKHAILLQMAMLPLTMSRFSIACLSDTIFNRFIPMERSQRVHIIIGYTMGALTVLANVLFFAYYGVLCAGGVRGFCANLTSEIMVTGYAISILVIAMLVTSFYRHRIRYEVFYVMHQLVFILYALTVLHTIDKLHRSQVKDRHQTFQWLVGSFAFYVCDRIAMRLNHKYNVRLVSSSTVKASDGSRMVILKLRRPVLFDFKPGQYAFIRISEIDNTFHPFTIASGPLFKYLEFYIEVFGDKSWTDKLWHMLREDSVSLEELYIVADIMGPYGTNIGKPEEHSHALAVGSGTGIVPVLSLLKQHVRQLEYLDPPAYFAHRKSEQRRVAKKQQAAENSMGSLACKLVAACFGGTFNRSKSLQSDEIRKSISRSVEKYDVMQSRNYKINTTELSRAARRATRLLYGVVILGVLTVIGTLVIGLEVSWDALGFLHDGMFRGLVTFDICFEVSFAVVALFFWDGNHFVACTDMAVCIAAPLLKWFVFSAYANDSESFVVNAMIDVYMTLRLWSMTMKPRNSVWCKAQEFSTFDRLEMIWVTRSCNNVSELLPDIEETWNRFETVWGAHLAEEVLRIKIYVTDKDPAAKGLLRQELRESSLYRRGWIRFERPDFEKILEEHSVDLICSHQQTSGCSSTLLSFCGSPVLARSIHQAKINNDMTLFMTGNKKHQMEFVSESYGGTVPGKAKAASKETEGEKSNTLISRLDIEYETDRRKSSMIGRSSLNLEKLGFSVDDDIDCSENAEESKSSDNSLEESTTGSATRSSVHMQP